MDAAGKKTAEAIQNEITQEVRRMLQVVFAGIHKSGRLDLEAVEMLFRDSLHRAGARGLGRVLSETSPPAAQSACACGQRARYHDTRSRQLVTAVGAVEFERSYYLCRHCHHGHSPRDRQLDVENVDYSPGVRRMMSLMGSDMSFDRGRQRLAQLAGIEVTAKAVERQSEAIGADIEARQQAEIHAAKQLDLPEVAAPAVPILYIEMDGTGVPMVKAELEQRHGRVEGEPARTREVKVGCVFTQTGKDEDGRPLRDQASTSYVAAIETAEEFGLRLYTEAWRRGWSRAATKVVIGDGAVWIWNLADQHFPGAIQIVDLYHARQHLWDLSGKLFAGDDKARKRWLGRCLNRLDNGKIEALVKTLQSSAAISKDLADRIGNEAEYFQRNADRMRYPSFRAQGFFVGSGVIEAACKTVIGDRLKRSGMFWTVRGANAIIALRCCELSNRFEDYWSERSKAA